MINFNEPFFSEKCLKYAREAILKQKKISGDGIFTKKVSEFLAQNINSTKVLMTTSCTHALEMAALLADIKLGDEVIMPSYTFVSTADAFVMRGAKIVFVDIRKDTMNIDETKIAAAITEKTRAIVPVHYAGVACEMDVINEIARKYNLLVIEDAAQGIFSQYKGRSLGSIGDFGCFSFHETKNFTMGEGGALAIRGSENVELAEIIREKGTNRSRFLRGQVDKYTWVEKGSSYLPSELNVAYLWGQLEIAETINAKRLLLWQRYFAGLKSLQEAGLIELPTIPKECTNNAHMFYIKVKDISERTKLIRFLKDNGILAVFHYVPLHSSKAGQKYGRFCGDDVYTTKESERLLRLPLFYSLTNQQVDLVIQKIKDFFKFSRPISWNLNKDEVSSIKL